ncbi:hypothetical protein GQ54DRAFT_307834 [Martensiomyces pterosporus]|nr:hypothetical protein GQ54DRAFT_307834 [Martensiomyces pterosporus]
MSLRNVLRDKVGSDFRWHPILMATALLITTEATVILQHAHWPTPPHSRRPSRTCHMVLQCVAMASGIGGIIAGAYKHRSSGSPSHLASAHAQLGLLAVLMLLAQALFGMNMSFSARIFGWRGNGKRWYKHHRALGYLTLIALWTSAWLGIHTRWSQSSGDTGGSTNPETSEWTWLAIFASLILGILLAVDTGKLGFK